MGNDLAVTTDSGRRLREVTTLSGRHELPGDQREPPPAIGATIGSYLVQELIGDGGMGRVYLARHVRLGRRVALKVLRSRFAKDRQAVERFFQEARAVNQIRHENIVEVTDFIDGEDGHSCYVMELLEGRTLADVIADDGPLPIERMVAIARYIASAMAAVHGAKIIHRDLKPANIIVTPRPGHPHFVKLLDFGVAKLVDASGASLSETQVGGAVGTPLYMAPEQLRSTQGLDARAHIYAFGVVLYQMVTGRLPFVAASVGDLVYEQLTSRPEPPRALRPELPEVLEQLILGCLAIKREERPASMREIEDALARMDEGVLQARTPPQPMPRPELDDAGVDLGPERSRVYLAASLGLAALVLATTAGIVLIGSASARERQEVEPGTARVAAPAAEPPREVEVRVSSTPAGATVVVVGEDEPRGTTPLVLRFAAGSGSRTLQLAAPDHDGVTVDVETLESTGLTVVLPKRPRARPPRRPTPPVTPQRAAEPTPDPPAEPAPPRRAEPPPRRKMFAPDDVMELD